MPRITPDDLWSLLVRTGLCSGPAAAAIRGEHDALPAAAGADAKAVAAWLVERGTITRWQAKRLSSGDEGPFFAGDYRLLERHEHDGEAFEFTARHEPSGRIVTVVLMGRKPWQDPAIRTAILRRTTIATRTSDPLLVRTWALEEADGRPFAVCEEVRSGSLGDELAGRGALPLREAGEIVLAVARAVAEIHAAGDVHGGLSLDALVHEPAAAGGRLRLRQFPLATDPHRVPARPALETADDLARLGRRAAFVAPELVAGDDCDARSDVYALGCILHALVCGTAPHWRGDARETLDRAAAAVAPGRETTLPPLDPQVAAPQLARLVEYMTARDPGQRYPDAAEAARAIAICFGLPADDLVAPVEAAFVFEPRESATPTADRPATAAERPSPQVAAVAAVRRRARRLRTAAACLAGGILAAAAAIVVVFTMPPPRPRRASDDDLPRPPVAVAAANPVRNEPATNEPVRTEPVRTEPPPLATVALAPPPSSEKPAEPPRASPPPPSPPPPAGPTIVADATLPWASPTVGPPPVIAYLPAGSQVVLLVRPADLVADEEGRLFVRALGPAVESALAAVAAACGCEAADIETIQVGWQAEGTDAAVVGWTARLVEGRSLPADEAFRTRAWGAAAPAARAGETIHAGPRLAYWAPASAAGRVLVAAPAGRLAEIVEAAAVSDPPVLALPTDLERLASRLDATRHLTVLGSPHFLLNGGRGLLTGRFDPVAAGIEDLLGEGVQAAAVSVHCGADFYVELDAAPTLDQPASSFATRLAERIAGYPAAARAFCAGRDLHPYGRALVMELPTMVRALAANVRAAAEGKEVVANAYLPRHAGHNIALAAELALAQAAAGPAAASPAAVASAPPPAGALGRLDRRMTLAFAKDTLEKSIQMIAEEVGVPMEILGPDLQLDGITKNQSFALDERDKPAREILRVILAKANPDGKLVYVVRRKDGVESIEITTRAAAAKRGDPLPPEFQEAGGKPARKGR